MLAAITVALLMKAASIVFAGHNLPFVVEKVLANEIWFVLGMTMSTFEWNKKLGWGTAAVGVSFIPVGIGLWLAGWRYGSLYFLLGILGCTMVISFVFCRYERKGKNSAALALMVRYNMPIFLMHTIFAAGTRIILFKIGIRDPWVHIVAGLAASFLGPSLAGWIMGKTKYLNFFLYPSKYVKIK